MTLNKLASAIAKREGKKHQASVGDVREILSILGDILAEEMCESDGERSTTYESIAEIANKKIEKLWAKKEKAAKAEEKRAKKAAQPKEPIKSKKKK